MAFGTSRMNRSTRRPVLIVPVFITLFVSLGMGIVIVTLRIGVIGVVIIGRGVLVARITGVRIVATAISGIRGAGSQSKQQDDRE